MSGCFDGAVGDAEADDDSDETTVINNYYNNVTDDGVMSIHIEDENTYNVTLNGTTLEILTVWYYDNTDDLFLSTNNIRFKVECANGFELIGSGGGYLPVIPNVECKIEFNYYDNEQWEPYDYSKILVVKEHSLSSL